LVALGVAVGAMADDVSSKPPSKEQIAAWIKGLQSDSFDEREKASKALWKAGQTAEEPLRQVLKDGDAEAVRRAREILDKFNWGIYPGTPEAVVGLIDEYRSGTPESQAAIVPKLMDHGSAGYTALMKIASMEKEATVRAQIWALVTADLPRLAGSLLAEGQERRLEEILEQGLTGEGDQPHANYAAYWMARGKLDEKIRALEMKAGAGRDKKTSLTLAYLCRAKGDLAGARKYAERAAHSALLQTVLVEQEEWKALFKTLDDMPAPAPAGFLAPPEASAPQELRLACLRLSGDHERFEAELKKLATDQKHVISPTCFLLNGRPDDAQAWLTKQGGIHVGGSRAVELLAARQRFRQALDLAKAERPAESEKNDDPASVQLTRAGLLARLGERKQARELFDKLAADVKPEDRTARLSAIVIAEYNAGFKDEAFARVSDLLTASDEKERPNLFDLLFQPLDSLFQPANLETGVGPWWGFLRRKFADEPVAATLKRLRDLVSRKLPAGGVAPLFK
jgi:tetratricopeptide (TPR) repeat protein